MKAIASPAVMAPPEPAATIARQSATSSGRPSLDRAPLPRSVLQRQIDESPRMAAQRRMLGAVDGAHGRQPPPVGHVKAAQLLKAPTEKALLPGKGHAAAAQLMLEVNLVDKEDREQDLERQGTDLDHERGDDSVSSVGWASGYVLPTRWYSWDGSNTYTPRTIGLPAATGWVNIDATRKGKPIYMALEDFVRWRPVRLVGEVADEVEELAKTLTEKFPLLQNTVHDQGQLLKDVKEMHQRVLTVNAALGEYLKRGSTPIKLILSVLGLTAAVSGGILLSYITLPTWVVALVDGLSFLYGCYVLYRWTTSELLPTMIKMILLPANVGAMVGTTAPVLGQLAAYYIGLTESFPLQHITLAAIPFALIIEQLIVKALERVNLVRLRLNDRNNHPNVDPLG